MKQSLPFTDAAPEGNQLCNRSLLREFSFPLLGLLYSAHL